MFLLLKNLNIGKWTNVADVATLVIVICIETPKTLTLQLQLGLDFKICALAKIIHLECHEFT